MPRCCRIPRTTTTLPRRALRRVARALGGSDAAEAEALLFALNARLGIAPALADLGMPEAGLDKAADLACRNPYVNPRPIEREAIRALLQRAWEGARRNEWPDAPTETTMSHDHHDGDASQTAPVVASFDGTPSRRLRTLMRRLARHQHAFVVDRS